MASTGGEAFPKRLRLRRRREFLAVQRGHSRVVTPHFLVYGRPNGGRPTRLGVTVSRKVGRSHVRNRVKRLVREAFRRHRDQLPGGLDLVLVARQGRPVDDYAVVVAELISAAGELQRGGGADRRRRRRA